MYMCLCRRGYPLTSDITTVSCLPCCCAISVSEKDLYYSLRREGRTSVGMPERAAVVFLFAQEKLLFRYPLHNPFEIDVTSSMNSNSNNPTTVTGTAAMSGAPGGYTRAKDRYNSASSEAPAARGAVDATTQTIQPQQPAASAAVAVRHKPRSAKRSQFTTTTTTATTTADADSDAARVSRGARLATAPSMLPSLSPEARDRRTGRNEIGSKSVEKGSADTCVGLQTTALLHLLRASFSTCTTIEFAGGIFLVYPLLPNPVKSRRPPLSKSWMVRDDDADGIDDENGVKGGKEGQKNDNGRGGDDDDDSYSDGDDAALARQSCDVLLVVAMSQPDREDSAIANFVQVFINVLVREELQSRYVTSQVLQIERRLCAWEMGGGGGGGGDDESENEICSAARHPIGGRVSSGAGGGGQRPSAAEMFTYLLQDEKLSLCAEISNLSKYITASRQEKDYVSATSPSPVLSSHSQSGIGINTPNMNMVTGGGTEFLVRGLFSLSLVPMLGRPSAPAYISSAYARYSPNYIVTLEYPDFVERLAKPYAEAVGRRASHLLPLTAIRAALAALPLPWRIGALYRALERSFAEASQQRQAAKQQQYGYGHSNAGGSSSSSNINHKSMPRSSLTRTEEAPAVESSLVALADEQYNPVADGDVLVVEAVEFLRMSGALVVDTDLKVVFTHSDLFPAAGVARWSGGNRQKVTASGVKHIIPLERSTEKCAPKKPASLLASASMVGMMLLDGLRASASGAGGEESSNDGCGTPLPAAEELSEMPLAGTTITTAGMIMVNSSHPTSSVAGATVANRHAESVGDDIPHFEVYCAWGDACPICEELASAPHLWRVGAAAVRLTFPFLCAPVADAALRRSLLGPRPLDPECCSLLADQQPWFTHPNTLMSQVALVGGSPQELYHRLTQGQGDEARKRVTDDAARQATDGCPFSTCIASCKGGSKRQVVDEDDEITMLTPDAIPAGARVWLAANSALITSRLHAALQQRQALDEAAMQLAEQKRAAAALAAEVEAIRVKGAGGVQQRQHQQQQSPPWENRRYQKRVTLTPSSASSVTADILPFSPKIFSLPQGSLTSPQLRHVDVENPISIPVRLIGTVRLVPFEALMQFVLHHAVALLWGKPGMNVERLLRLLERNLRRLRPFLTHYAYLRQLPVTAACAYGAGFSTVPACCSSTKSESPPPGQESQVSSNCTPSSLERKRELVEEPMTDLERQLQQASIVFEELSLMDALRELNGMNVEVVPTRLLLHAVVNSFSDVLFIGGGVAQTGVGPSVL